MSDNVPGRLLMKGERFDWRDPNMRVIRKALDHEGKWVIGSFSAEAMTENAKYGMLYGEDPHWTVDPTYNMRRK